MLQQKKMMSLLYGYFYHCEVCWIRATGSPSSSSSSLCWLRRFSPLSAERERACHITPQCSPASCGQSPRDPLVGRGPAVAISNWANPKITIDGNYECDNMLNFSTPSK